jgi:hypothetical protein
LRRLANGPAAKPGLFLFAGSFCRVFLPGLFVDVFLSMAFGRQTLSGQLGRAGHPAGRAGASLKSPETLPALASVLAVFAKPRDIMGLEAKMWE